MVRRKVESEIEMDERNKALQRPGGVRIDIVESEPSLATKLAARLRSQPMQGFPLLRKVSAATFEDHKKIKPTAAVRKSTKNVVATQREKRSPAVTEFDVSSSPKANPEGTMMPHNKTSQKVKNDKMAKEKPKTSTMKAESPSKRVSHACLKRNRQRRFTIRLP